jgi:hypothetical protein
MGTSQETRPHEAVQAYQYGASDVERKTTRHGDDGERARAEPQAAGKEFRQELTSPGRC